MTDAVQRCRGCDLYAGASRAVFGAGRARARVMLVGEQPGDAEDRAGKPFVGPAGRVLRDAIERSGLASETLYLTNAVKHFRWRPAKDSKRRLHQTPTGAQVGACNPWLRAELATVSPKLVILLGAIAGQSLFGAGFRVSDSRGRPLEWPGGLDERPPDGLLFASIHPSAVLRAVDRSETFDGLVDDLTTALEALDA
jgi:DNA polymerase